MKFIRPISRQIRYFSIANPKSQKLPPISSSINNNIKELHGHLIRTHNHKDPNKIFLVLRNYSNSLSTLSKAQLIFDQIKKPQFIIWYYMIKAWSKSDDPIKTIHLYNNMRVSGLNGNHLTIIFALKACGRISDVLQGKRVHVNVIKIGFESYLFVSNALIYMYGFCGEMGFAQKVFDGMLERDLVSWNSLICGFSRCCMYDRVLSVFDSMQVAGVRADAVTLVKVVMACNVLSKWSVADDVVDYIERNCVDVDVYLGNTIIDMCGNRGLVELARRVFDRMSKKDLVSWNSLLKVYVKSGDLISARKLFNDMPIRDVISWTSLITGYSQAGKYSDAVKCFQNMMTSEIKPNEVTIASVLSACAHLGMLDLGQEIHKFISEKKILVDIYVGNALIDMYCKCGDVERALQVFLGMKEKDSVSWSAVISGLAVNGSANDAIQLFEEMLGENVMLTNGTFVGILLACSHAGLVDKGLEYFQSMQNVYGISPQMKHYGCVVDLLSRSGRLERAYEFILKMPIPADVVLWRILLSACKLHENITLAETVSKKLLELDAGNSGNYVLISDTCASAEKWDSATMFRDLMGENSVQKPSAWSSIEVQQQNNTPLP
ncbi:pentatricopeptide repeat-containing protein At2g29760, chloroplastic-like [Silene latifolia]|uniref:pentatricopeptide repeat-containing protein At2g29760, chloroplastic-like n=1 Tax=Silene latifolia TaxID=37657 RepID=UPI003D786541